MTCEDACGRKKRVRRKKKCGSKKKKKRCARPGPVLRNAFLNFLRDFRRTRCGRPMGSISREAAKKWKCMSICRRSKYIKEACRVCPKKKKKKRKRSARNKCGAKRRKKKKRSACGKKKRRKKKRKCA